jgi:phosphorylcholine metabolism protein LicD
MIILNKKNIHILCFLVVIFIIISFLLTYKDELNSIEKFNINKDNDIFNVNKHSFVNEFSNKKDNDKINPHKIKPYKIKPYKYADNYSKFLKTFKNKQNPVAYNPAGIYSNNIQSLKRPLTDIKTKKRLRTIFELMNNNYSEPFNTKPNFF